MYIIYINITQVIMLRVNRNFHETMARRGASPDNIKQAHQQGGRVLSLKEQVNPEVERELKADVMLAREVVLEQDRLVAVLLDKFRLLQDEQNLEVYCRSIGVDQGIQVDLEHALPRIIGSLEQSAPNDIFSEIAAEEGNFFEELYARMKTDVRRALAVEGLDILAQQIVEAEIELALTVLMESRSRPILSHRERKFSGDEASQEALQAVLEENIAEIEFDIRASQDGRAIIHHNATLGESADMVGKVREFTAEQLENVELRNGDHICSLEKLFQMIQAMENKTTKVNIDIKDFDKRALDEILTLIHDYGMEHRVVIVSWLPQSLQYLYEKDPTLSYSMSYFPAIRGVSRWLIEKIEDMPSGSLLFGKIGSWFAKWRDNAVQGIGAENIAHGVALDANENWEDVQARTAEVGTDLIGKHTVAYSDPPVADIEGGLDTMARVLHNGSVNIMVFEEKLNTLVDRLSGIPVIGKWIADHKKEIINFFGRTTQLAEYAQELSENGVRVNIFDVTDDGVVDQHIRTMREAGVEPGVVYFSGKYHGLHTRDMTPDLGRQDQ